MLDVVHRVRTRSALLALAAGSASAGCARTPHGAAPAPPPAGPPRALALIDAARGRRVPLALYYPASARPCVRARTCPVAFLSPGRGVPHTAYTFLAGPLAAAGYLVVAVQHDLPDDPPLATAGSLVAVRTPLWARGAETLRFLRAELAAREPGYDWARLVLVGHSNGGDLSALALVQTPGLAGTLVTLDHRRAPLPRRPGLRVLSVRATDFAADPGVLPSASEAAALGYCVTTVAGARHDELQDAGAAWEKAEVARRVVAWLTAGRCAPTPDAPIDGR